MAILGLSLKPVQFYFSAVISSMSLSLSLSLSHVYMCVCVFIYMPSFGDKPKLVSEFIFLIKEIQTYLFAKNNSKMAYILANS
jgi:hypothetical protein